MPHRAAYWQWFRRRTPFVYTDGRNRQLTDTAVRILHAGGRSIAGTIGCICAAACIAAERVGFRYSSRTGADLIDRRAGYGRILCVRRHYNIAAARHCTIRGDGLTVIRLRGVWEHRLYARNIRRKQLARTENISLRRTKFRRDKCAVLGNIAVDTIRTNRRYRVNRGGLAKVTSRCTRKL